MQIYYFFIKSGNKKQNEVIKTNTFPYKVL